jgi:addiction module RelE/StbE family toxin
MALPIVWSQAALRDLQSIAAYIAVAENETVAERMRLRIEQSVLPASDHPYIFRAGRREGTREVVAHPNYIVVYRLMTDRIRVVGVVHTRRKYP